MAAVVHRIAGRLIGVLMCAAFPANVVAQDPTTVQLRNDSITMKFLDTELRLAIQAIARYLDKPLMFGNLADHRVTLETPGAMPVAAVPDVLAGLLRMYNLELVSDSQYYSVRDVQPTYVPDAQPLVAVQVFVLRLRHARASDVAATVSALYGMGAAFGEPGATSTTLSESLSQNLVPVADVPADALSQPITDLVAQLSGDVRIIPDPRTNSLLIRATARDFELIKAAAEQLDVRPLQVLIEVVIAEVRRDNSLAFGVNAFLDDTRLRGTTTEIGGEIAGPGLGDFVLRAMNLGGSDLAVVLRAAASRGQVSILSRPVILAANNEIAEILVGSQRPFVQVQRALPTDAAVRDQVVQFKDVGTRLTVIPTVSEDGYVMMEVTQEVNAATAEIAFDAPVISTRSVRTQLLVRDGKTAILGGLADRQREVTRTGVPLLSAIPLIGGLFGSQSWRTTETELFIFLTPRVIRSDDDLEDAAEDAGDKTRDLLEESVRKASPLPS